MCARPGHNALDTDEQGRAHHGSPDVTVCAHPILNLLRRASYVYQA